MASTKAKKGVGVKPKVEKSPKVVSSQLGKKLKKQKKYFTNRGVVLIRSLPHGFYEEQLKSYFGQFGKVTRVRVVRSRKTTKSRGFAYVEFQYPEVAEIAAETMNNYMMFKKMIKTVYIPPKEQKFNYFKSGVLMLKSKDGKEVLTTRYRLKQAHGIEKFNRVLTEEELEKRQKAEKKKVTKLQKKLAKHDIDYNINAILPPNLRTAANESMKDESEESEIEAPEKLEFEDDSQSESENHDLDSDASVEVDPVKAKKKKGESILFAKNAGKKLKAKPEEPPKKKTGEKTKKTEKVEKKKLAGVKKTPAAKSSIKEEKLKAAAKISLKKKDQVKLVEKPIVKTKQKNGRKLK